MKKVNILGTEYTIEIVKISECEQLKENHWSGSCNNVLHTILIGDADEEEFFGKLTDEEKILVTKEILRHEIIHAFFNESGLKSSAFTFDRAWAENEEMVDWIAQQFPKIQKVFKELDCL